MKTHSYCYDSKASSTLLLAPCNYCFESFDTLVGVPHLLNPQLDQSQCDYLVYRTLVMKVVATTCWLQPSEPHPSITQNLYQVKI